MKKSTVWTLFVLALTFAGSCKKTSPSDNHPAIGSWSFKGKTYTQAQGYVYGGGELVATSTSPGSTILISFYNTVPTTGGTYTVVHNEFANQMAIEFDDSASSTIYYSDDPHGAIQPATVAVSSAGKLSVSGSNITLYNQHNSADSASFTLNVVQQ